MLERAALALARDVRSAIRALRVRPRAFGLGIQSKGKDARAIELHAEQKAMAEALGDRAGVETACCNLGKCYAHTGEYARAIELHAEHKEMAEELGDRAEVEAACGNLGNCYHSTGEHARAIELHAEAKAISEALGGRTGVEAA